VALGAGMCVHSHGKKEERTRIKTQTQRPVLAKARVLGVNRRLRAGGPAGAVLRAGTEAWLCSQ
jgi:hypothetical protein